MTSVGATPDPPVRWRSARPARVVAVAAALLVGLALASCTGSGDDGAEAVDASTTSVRTRDQRLPTIRLGVTDWTGAEVNVAIAEQVIERRLGYPVEAVPIVDMGRMLADLDDGRLDAVLELWPSGLLDSEQQAIDDGRFVDLGALGVEGQIGWYVPRYVTDGDRAVTSWEDLADPAVARTFATPSTGSRGRFLGTDPIYEQYDEELIESLELPFDVEYSGSDTATEAAVAAAVRAGEPILLNWWTPTALVARYDLVALQLPPRTADCVADAEAGEPWRCGYAVDELFKIGSPDLAEKASDVHHVLREFRLTTDEQLSLIDEIDNGGLSVEDAAAAWIGANQARWESWLP